VNPRDALTQQQLLRDNLTRPGYIDYLQEFSEDVHRKGSIPLILDSRGKPSGALMAASERMVLERAEAFFVTADMAQVVAFASTGLDALDRFAQDLWPAESGFLWFEQGVPTVDVWGTEVPFQAMTWHRRSTGGHPGTLVFLYTNVDDRRDAMAQRLGTEKVDRIAASMGRLHLAHTAWLADGQRVGPSTATPPEDYQQYAEEGRSLVPATNTSRLILALLMLLGQTITVTTRHDLRPTNPKRARKMKVPGMVTVVTLRHAKNAVRQEGETQVEWQHRWLVKGHWRSQACGPNYPQAQEVGPGQYRARIYIAPFIKGPDEAPFKQSTKVYNLAR
jgi:hypothetical protein